MNKSSLSPGIILNSRYRVEKVLGHGGFGITYLCRDTKTGKEVAVKELFRDKLCSRLDDGNVECHNTEALREFERLKVSFEKESALLRGLSHPNIVRVLDSFEQNNTSYYAMDYVEGCSLDRIIEEKVLPEEQAFGVISHIASALQYLHSRNILHLDLKPANIIIDSDWKPTIIDFGEATDSSATKLREETGVAFSSGFAAIEQYQPDSILAPSTDIYALGATYYNMLTGEVPPVASDLVSHSISGRIGNNISSRAKWAITQAMQCDARLRPDADRFIKMADRDIPMEDLVESLDDETASEKLKSFKSNLRGSAKSAWRNYPMTVVSAACVILLLIVIMGIRQGWLAPASDSVLTPVTTIAPYCPSSGQYGTTSAISELIHDTNARPPVNSPSPAIRLRLNNDTLTVSVYLTKNSSSTFNSLRSTPTSSTARNLAATSSLYSSIMDLTQEAGLKLRTEYIYIPDGTAITSNQPWAPLDPNDQQAFKDFNSNLLMPTIGTQGHRLVSIIPLSFDGKNLFYTTESIVQFNELNSYPSLTMSDRDHKNISGVNRIIEKNRLYLILINGEGRAQRISRPIPFDLSNQ